MTDTWRHIIVALFGIFLIVQIIVWDGNEAQKAVNECRDKGYSKAVCEQILYP